MNRALLLIALAGPLVAACTTCTTRSNAAASEIYAVVNDFSECTIDADCTSVSVSTSCRGDCPVAVNVDGAGEVADAVDSADATHCASYPSDCDYETPTCPTASAQCVDGECEMVEE